MLLSRFAGAAVLAATATLSIAGVANAQDRDCADFGNQAEAQRFFDSATANFHRLDADNDGIACEHLPAPSHVPATRRTQPPVGPIDAGDGSTADDSPADDSGAPTLLLGLAGLGAAGAVAVRRARRSN